MRNERVWRMGDRGEGRFRGDGGWVWMRECLTGNSAGWRDRMNVRFFESRVYTQLSIAHI